MRVAIVTAIYDLKSRSDYFNRSVDEYIALQSYIASLGYPMYCFTEEAFKDRVNGTVIVKPLEQLPTNDLILKEGRTVAHAMKDGKAHPGHVLYAIVNNAKVFMVEEIMQQYPQYDLYLWLDSGIAHVDPCSPAIVDNAIDSLSHDRITLLAINYPNFNDVEDYWSVNRYNIAGGLMAFTPHQMPWFKEEYIKTLQLARDKGFICLEEQIIPVFAVNNTDKIDFRFTDYRVFSNLKYITTDIDVIIRNITTTPQDVCHSLVKRCIESIEQGAMRCSPEQFAFILYHAHYKCYYFDRALSDRLATIINALITFKSNSNVSQYKSTIMIGDVIRRYNVESNIKFNKPKSYSSWREYLENNPDDIKLIALYL